MCFGENTEVPIIYAGYYLIKAILRRKEKALDSDWYLHFGPDKFVLHNLSGKKEIAATTANSDG